MRHLFIAVSLVLAPGGLTAQSASSGDRAHATVALPDRITWTPAPAILPSGAKVAILQGNPAEAGPFTMRLWAPDGYRIASHYHPAVEHITVIQGTFKVGMGEKFDASALTELPAGTFAALPPDTRHFAQAHGETIIQLHGVGPWKLTYVNPADDPRR
jgi:anti-sigma factor ChrR (cupin superfamily)